MRVDTPSDSYARRIGPFSATMMVVGGIVGSGIFLNPGLVAERVRTAELTLLVWGVGGCIAMVGPSCMPGPCSDRIESLQRHEGDGADLVGGAGVLFWQRKKSGTAN